jgi:succinate dehydrogenase/fumarate reductase flavoprotein subunit
VTGGGVPLNQIDCATGESRLLPGLFLCGEVLDVFGRIGGFNFHAAWVTGRLAGRGAAAAAVAGVAEAAGADAAPVVGPSVDGGARREGPVQ